MYVCACVSHVMCNLEQRHEDEGHAGRGDADDEEFGELEGQYRPVPEQHALILCRADPVASHCLHHVAHISLVPVEHEDAHQGEVQRRCDEAALDRLVHVHAEEDGDLGARAQAHHGHQHHRQRTMKALHADGAKVGRLGQWPAGEQATGRLYRPDQFVVFLACLHFSGGRSAAPRGRDAALTMTSTTTTTTGSWSLYAHTTRSTRVLYE